MDKNMIMRTVLILVAAIVLFALIQYYNTQQKAMSTPASALKTDHFLREGFADPTGTSSSFLLPKEDEGLIKRSQTALNGDAAASEVQPSDEVAADGFRPVDFATQKLPNDCFPKDRLTTEDLLPKGAANLKWSVVNPAGQGDVSNANFLQAGTLQGINSTLGSMRNANLQLRSDPVIPNASANWPIMMSTIPRNSSIQRKPLEISGDCGGF